MKGNVQKKMFVIPALVFRHHAVNNAMRNAILHYVDRMILPTALGPQ